MKRSHLKAIIKEIVKTVHESMTTRAELNPGTMMAANVAEKTNPDGTYTDDMESGMKSQFMSGLDEMTSSGAAGGQPGGTIQVPAWGTKNKNGSPRAIKAAKKYGTVVKSISEKVKQ